ncbi:MAG: glycosyltransferase [Vulcanimicrobiota bacterium]
MSYPKVVHLTSAHPTFDNRIFFRECRWLARAGYDVVLIAAHSRDEELDGVRILSVDQTGGRLKRMLLRTLKVFARGYKENASLYHFHDPELIPAALLLRLLGKSVVYDIHEDNRQNLKTKPYFPRHLAELLAVVLGFSEQFLAGFFYQVIAEKCYSDRFPRATPVLNYPILERIRVQTALPSKPHLLYTGTIVESRGALIHCGLTRLNQGIEVTLCGRFAPGLREQLEREFGSERLHLEGSTSFMEFELILETYERHCWSAGLAIFPSDCIYGDRELTKFFEYMALGVPIICSRFPAWVPLIEENQVGICVDPDSPAEIARAISFLEEHPEKAREMGRRGRELALQRYSWESQARNLIELYHHIGVKPDS